MEVQSQVSQEHCVTKREDLDANMNETGICRGTGENVPSTERLHVLEEDRKVATMNILNVVTETEGRNVRDHSQVDQSSNIAAKSPNDRNFHEESRLAAEIIANSINSPDEISNVKEQSCSNLNASSNNDFRSNTTSLTTPFSTSASRSATASPVSSPASSMTSQNDSTPRCPKNEDSIRGKRRRRGSAWTDDETEYLLEIWAKQSEIMKESGSEESATSAPVYRLISRSLAEFGWEKTWEQCKTRIHTLKRAYKITKDEIESGTQTVTYCRHFDKLEIISGDNPTTTPGMLALTLEQKRLERGAQFRGKKIPVRRKLTVGENPNLVKRAKTNSCRSFANGADTQLQIGSSFPDVSGISQADSSSNTAWYSQISRSQSFQQAHQHDSNQANQNSISSVQFVSAGLPAAPNYPYPSAAAVVAGPPPPYSSVVDNKVQIKTERDENTRSSGDQVISPYSHLSTSSHGSVLQAALSQPVNQGNDLERMRLDLEMRKLEVERNKIEMEERQRREERDHQYRMMQLLLFGLGQPNISQLLSGQGGSEMAHAHSTDILRALENGLVPGGSQKANEKGLSFNEL